MRKMTIALAWLAVVHLAGCPRPSRRTLVAEVPKNGDATAHHRFVEARNEFVKGGGKAEVFGELAQEFADDPIAPWASMYQGIAELANGDAKAAAATFAAVPCQGCAIATQLAIWQAIAAVHVGKPSPTLAGFATQMTPRGEPGQGPAADYRELRSEYWAAVAIAATRQGDHVAALAAWDQFAVDGSAVEQSYAVGKIDEVVGALDRGVLRTIYQNPTIARGRPSGILVARQLAALADAQGDSGLAKGLRAGVADDAEQYAIAVDQAARPLAATVQFDRTRLAVLISTQTKHVRVGESMLAALAELAGASGGAGKASVDVVPLGEGKATDSVTQIGASQVAAALAPSDAANVDAVADAALAAGMPVISLSPRPEERKQNAMVFHIMHSGEARARALAAAALARGVTRFAILAPANGYGKTVGEAFETHVVANGGVVDKRVEYPADTKSFAPVAGKMTGNWQALFVPDQADKLELIAPALAAAGLVAKPVATQKVTGGKPILLLATAEGITPGFFANAGRYCDGAVLAPGYVAGSAEPAAAVFDRDFFSHQGRMPTAFEAYVFDAASMLLHAAAGAVSRADVATRLLGMRHRGLTGTIALGPNHVRTDAGVLYVVSHSATTGTSVKVLP